MPEMVLAAPVTLPAGLLPPLPEAAVEPPAPFEAVLGELLHPGKSKIGKKSDKERAVVVTAAR
jgi:hypothetical protein